MRELRTEIEIAAPISKVWSILTGFNDWEGWNPIVNQASGVASLGSKLSITMCGKDGKSANKYTPVLIEIDQPKSFRWRATMMAGFLFTNDKVCKLEETAAGTRLIHIEAFSGLPVPIFWGKMEKPVPQMLKSMNDALKMTAEKRSD